MKNNLVYEDLTYIVPKFGEILNLALDKSEFLWYNNISKRI